MDFTQIGHGDAFGMVVGDDLQTDVQDLQESIQHEVYRQWGLEPHIQKPKCLRCYHKSILGRPDKYLQEHYDLERLRRSIPKRPQKISNGMVVEVHNGHHQRKNANTRHQHPHPLNCAVRAGHNFPFPPENHICHHILTD